MTQPSESFHTTRWSLVLQAGRTNPSEAKRALEELCQLYWYPLYAFARKEGLRPEEAEDLTQGFFLSLLERQDLQNVSSEKGRFRSFLRTAMKHFLINHWRSERTLKRGGGKPPLPLELLEMEKRYQVEDTDQKTSEQLFDREWALTVLELATRSLETEYEQSAKLKLYEVLKATLSPHEGTPSFAELGQQLGITEGAARTAAYRLRKQFQRHLREQVAETLDEVSEEAIDDEIRKLFTAISG